MTVEKPSTICLTLRKNMINKSHRLRTHIFTQVTTPRVILIIHAGQ